jgi:2-hydroxy-6-oxonona-2,4-dienedioate hydrolase
MRLAIVLSFIALAVTAGGALVFNHYEAELHEARTTAEHGGRIAQTARGPIEYADTGTGMPLLSIHGAGGGQDQGISNVAGLIGDDFRVIAPSRFGYLRTRIPSDTSSAAQADAHAALLDTLQIDRAAVVGVSAGARSAVELAIRHPTRVSALILIVPGTYAPTSPVAVEARRTSAFVLWLVNTGADFTWWVLEKVAPSILVRFIGVPPELLAAAPTGEQERVMQIVRRIEPLSLRFAGINIDSNPLPGRPALERITAPTLVISARDDLFNTLPAAKFAASQIRNAKLVAYDTGGHLLVGRQEEVRKLVTEFLSSVPATSRNVSVIIPADRQRGAASSPESR